MTHLHFLMHTLHLRRLQTHALDNLEVVGGVGPPRQQIGNALIAAEVVHAHEGVVILQRQTALPECRENGLGEKH